MCGHYSRVASIWINSASRIPPPPEVGTPPLTSTLFGGRAWYIHYLLYPCERGPTTEYRPTPFGLNFLLRPTDYLNIHPCIAALEKHSSNGRTELELRIVYVRLIINLPNSCKPKPS